MATLLIKNMVCKRCILSVQQILHEINIDAEVEIGEIHTKKEPTTEEIKLLEIKLDTVGFELINNYQTEIIEKIKQKVILKARNEVNDFDRKLKLSNYLTSYISKDYSYLSNLFSEVEGRTIENLFIEQRIEKVKELLVYNQLTLSEIAYELDYSSVAHLSSQFKKVTGLTPSYFKTLGNNKRKGLDKI